MKQPTVEEQIKFFENIFNDDELYVLVLASFISSELDYSEEKKTEVLRIVKMLIENFEKMKFKTKKRKNFVKKQLQEIPKILSN